MVKDDVKCHKGGYDASKNYDDEFNIIINRHIELQGYTYSVCEYHEEIHDNCPLGFDVFVDKKKRNIHLNMYCNAFPDECNWEEMGIEEDFQNKLDNNQWWRVVDEEIMDYFKKGK